MSEPDTPWLTIEQAAERLQVSVRTVERAVAAGTLAEYRPYSNSRARRYRVQDVDAAMAPAATCTDVLEPAHGGPRHCSQPEGHKGLHGDGAGTWAR